MAYNIVQAEYVLVSFFCAAHQGADVFIVFLYSYWYFAGTQHSLHYEHGKTDLGSVFCHDGLSELR